jgi:predicted DNA-binding transcriptional regulator YafY
MIRTAENLKSQLLAATYERRILKITYCAPGSAAEAPVREIEPYSIIEINGASMLKAWQLQPTSGWRLFNIALIESIVDTGMTFERRRSFVMHSDGNVRHIAPVESRDYEQLEYERMLHRAIIDLHVDPVEVRELAQARQRLGLTAEEVRGVHYRVFSDCLAAMTQDRLISDEERQMLIELNRCLHDCGAGLIQ